MLNLYANAIKFTERKGEIVIMVEKIKKVIKKPTMFSFGDLDDFEDMETDLITISVTDQGVGIADEE